LAIELIVKTTHESEQEVMEKYTTRIAEHIEAVNAELGKKGLPPLNMKDVARGAGISYSSIRRYVNAPQDDPNYAIINRVRMFLNSLLPKKDQFPVDDYIPLYEEDDEQGQPAALVVG
jgi:AraC-like DNA-binding protein